MAAKWARYSFEETRYKNKINQSIEDLKDLIKNKIFEKHKNGQVDTNRLSEVSLKLQAEQLIKQSSEYKKLKSELDNQDDIIRFVQEAKVIISQFGFDIKNSIDILKLENI